MTKNHAANFFGVLALTLMLAIAVWTGYRGIDFGDHWDEHLTLECARESIKTGRFIAGRYEYPSVTRDLALLCAGPGIFRLRLDSQMSLASLEERDAMKQMIAAQARQVDEPWFRLRVRTLFLVISLVSCVWIYLLVLVSGRDWKEALLAATLLGSSWQVAYHARWIAPDAILMQFSALTLLFAVLANRNPLQAKLWLGLAASAAGLGCSTKYAGAFLLLPVLVTAWFLWRNRKGGGRWGETMLEFLKLTALFCLAFILTTAGAWVEPGRVLADIFVGVHHYHAQMHYGNTVHPGGEHLWLLLKYLCLAAFSKYPLVAILFFVMIFVGVWSSIKSDWKEAAILVCAPLLYVVGFALQRVMNVRNLLLIFPLLAIFSARGTVVCIGRLPSRAGRISAAMIVVLACALNLVWLVRASDGIAHREQIDHARNIETYLRNHPGTQFYLSAEVSRSLGDPILHSLSNIASLKPDMKADAKVVFFSTEGNWEVYPANHYGYYEMVSGTYEVDFDYYSGWLGDRRVLAVSVKGNRLIIAPIENKVEGDIFDFTENVRLHPEEGDCHISLGIALSNAGRMEEAATHFQEALQINPGDVYGRNIIGNVFANQGRLDEAIHQYQEALRLQPDNADTHNNLGSAFARQGKLDEAIHEFQEALRLRPDCALASRRLARALEIKKTPAGR